MQSAAFKAIKSANTMRVLMEFYRRRVFHRRKNNTPLIMNNGQIELPYKYAIEKMDIPQTTFSRCLDELVELGFLDIAEQANGLHRRATKWHLSDRWKAYNSDEFRPVRRQHIKPPHGKKGTRGQAFGNSQKKIPVTMNGIKIA